MKNTIWHPISCLLFLFISLTGAQDITYIKPDFQVNENAGPYNTWHLSAAALENETFLSTWEHSPPTCKYAQFWNSDGSPIGQPFKLSNMEGIRACPMEFISCTLR